MSDAAAWGAGLFLATASRYAFEETAPSLAGLAATMAVAVIGLGVVGSLGGTYSRRFPLGSIDDLVNLTVVFLAVGTLLLATNIVVVNTQLVPRSVPLLASLIALGLAAAVRVVERRRREAAARPSGTTLRRVLVLGAGVSGQQLVRSMLSYPSGYLPVAFLDDDPNLAKLRVSGVPVVGDRGDIAAAAERTGADLLIVAVRKVDAVDLRELSVRATEAGLAVKVLPSFGEMFDPSVKSADLRDLDVTDLLGRRPVDTDLSSIAEFLSGKRVLVTGAGGSIGSELCRQLHRFGPGELMMLDRDESALHAVQLSITGSALLDSSDTILADIRDREQLLSIFRMRRPEVVFHAAALKHLPMLEQYPAEAWKTNVVGTMNVLEACRSIDVATLVNISTDKAANPTSVLGRSKRIGERLVADAASTSLPGTRFLSVRFGNVLGSRGSVLTTFVEQVNNGGPITVTDPDVTRFFMTIPEAVQLVVQAAVIGGPGQVLVLDMGEPVRIVDVAKQIMAVVGKPVPIVFTGLRTGEKLTEELFAEHEPRDHRPLHPEISHVDVQPLTWASVIEAGEALGPARAVHTMGVDDQCDEAQIERLLHLPTQAGRA